MKEVAQQTRVAWQWTHVGPAEVEGGTTGTCKLPHSLKRMCMLTSTPTDSTFPLPPPSSLLCPLQS
jgi:hypothetical protein